MKPRTFHKFGLAAQIKPGDNRDAMTRLLADCVHHESGLVEPDYAQQWPTLNKAARLGYVDDRNCLTEKGREFLRKGK